MRAHPLIGQACCIGAAALRLCADSARPRPLRHVRRQSTGSQTRHRPAWRAMSACG